MSQFTTKRPPRGHAMLAWDYATDTTGHAPTSMFFADWIKCWIADYPKHNPGHIHTLVSTSGELMFKTQDFLPGIADAKAS